MIDLKPYTVHDGDYIVLKHGTRNMPDEAEVYHVRSISDLEGIKLLVTDVDHDAATRHNGYYPIKIDTPDGEDGWWISSNWLVDKVNPLDESLFEI